MEYDSLKIYTAKDLQQIFGLSKNRIYDIMHQKAFPTIKIGRRYFVTEDALKEWASIYQYGEFYT